MAANVTISNKDIQLEYYDVPFTPPSGAYIKASGDDDLKTSFTVGFTASWSGFSYSPVSYNFTIYLTDSLSQVHEITHKFGSYSSKSGSDGYGEIIDIEAFEEEFETTIALGAATLTIDIQFSDGSSTITRNVDTISMYISNWDDPEITTRTVYRSNDYGTPVDTGTKLCYVFSMVLHPFVVGSGSFSYRIKDTDEESWTTVSIYENTDSINASTVISGTYPISDSYNFELIANDGYVTYTYSSIIPTGIALFHLNANKDGIGIGKYSEGPGLDVSLASHFRSNVQFDVSPTYLDPNQAIRDFGLMPLDASAFPPMVTDYMQNSETGNAFALESQSSGTFERQDPETNHPGVIGVKTSSSANSGGRSKLGLNTFVLGGGEVYEHIFRVVYTSNTTGKYGLHDSYTSAAPTNGAWINVSGTTLTGKTRNASTESTTASSYTITAGIWYHLKIEVNADATLVTFSLYAEDGTLLWSDTLSTDIPTTAGLTACAVATNSGTTARIINDFDWTLFRIDRALTR